MQFSVDGNELSSQGIESSDVEIEFELKLLKSSFARQQGLLLHVVLMKTQPSNILLPIEVQ